MEASITVLEWSPGGARAYNPVTRQFGAGSTPEEALRKVGASGAVGLCLGRRVSLIRETHVPDVDKAQLHMIMQLQLDSLFPAMNTELAFDFEKGTHRYEDGLQTTVVAAPAETVRRAVSEVEAAGAKVAWIAATCLGSKHIAKMAGHDDAIVVSLAEGHLNLDIVRHGLVVYSRSAVDPGSPEGRHAEVQRTLAGYGLPSATVIAVADLDIGTEFSRAEEFPLQAMAHHSPLVLNVELPESVEKRRKRASLKKTRVALFFWLCALVLGAFVWLDRDAAARAVDLQGTEAGRQRAGVGADIAQIEESLKQASASQQDLNVAFHPAQPISDVLTLVSNEVPEGAWLTGLTFERGKPLMIRGMAMDGGAVTAYTSALALNTRLRDVQLVFANNAEIEGTPVVQFSVSAHVVGNLPLAESGGKSGGKR